MPVQIKQAEGNKGERVLFTHAASGDTCEVYLFGGTLTSWVAKKEERIFMGGKCVVGGPGSLHGGIPLVFPQFATPKPDEPISGKILPQHGFARNSTFKWLGVVVDNNDEVTGRFSLNESQIPEKFRDPWPFKFQFVYTVTLKAGSLVTSIAVTNTDTQSWKFTTLLHTYFLVPDIAKLAIHGLQGCSYADKTDSSADLKKRDTETITITKENDAVHADVTNNTFVVDFGKGKENGGVKITKEGFKDVVVWNPYKTLSDWNDDEYKKMVCVEVGNVARPVSLAAGETWQAGQILTAL